MEYRTGRRKSSGAAHRRVAPRGTLVWALRSLAPPCSARRYDQNPAGICFLASLLILTLLSRRTFGEIVSDQSKIGSSISSPGIGATLTLSILHSPLSILRDRRRVNKPAGCFWMLACLLLSGDIETNPGPAIRVFSQNVRSLKKQTSVCFALMPVSWRTTRLSV